MTHLKDRITYKDNSKGKVVPWFNLSSMNMYGELLVQLHAFLISELDRGERSASCSCRFFPEKRALGVHMI
jgi:hypothetical protein